MSEVKTDKISSVSTNGDITLDPDGTGKVAIPAAVEVDSNDITVAFDGADDVNSLILQGSNGSSEKYTFELQADGGGSAAKFMSGSGGGAATERMRIDGGGKVLVNTTSTSANSIMTVAYNDYPLAIWNNGGTSGYFGQISFRNNANTSNIGTIIRTNDASVSYNTTSDYRVKENVEDMTGAIARVKQLAPKRFNFIADTSRTVDGFLAHEAQTIVPEAVHGTHNEVDDDGNAVMQGIDQSKLVPLLTGALKEAVAKIEALEARVTALEDA